jgi:hypothetical protein
VVHVDPAYTSQTCCECGHVDKKNRVDQALFICLNCGGHCPRGPKRFPQHRPTWRRGVECGA